MIDLSEKDLEELYTNGKTLCDYFNSKIEKNNNNNNSNYITTAISIISNNKAEIIKLSKLIKYYYDEPNRISKIKKFNEQYKFIENDIKELNENINLILKENKYDNYIRIFLKHQMEYIKIEKLLIKLKEKIIRDKVYNNDNKYASTLNILETHNDKILKYIHQIIYDINLITKYDKHIEMPKNK